MDERIPTEAECFDILSEVDVPPAVVRHSIAVKNFALELTDQLNAQGHNINKELITASALLHDVLKTSAEFDHAVEAGEFLRKKGFHIVAEVVEKHALNNLTDSSFIPQTPEEKLLMYADLRIVSGSVVSLDERFDYIGRQYQPKDPNKFKGCRSFAKSLEMEFHAKLNKQL